MAKEQLGILNQKQSDRSARRERGYRPGRWRRGLHAGKRCSCRPFCEHASYGSNSAARAPCRPRRAAVRARTREPSEAPLLVQARRLLLMRELPWPLA